MSVSDHSFPFFPRLPLELREEIWRCCLPHRVHELDAPASWIVYNKDNLDDLALCQMAHTTYMNARAPLISLVCRESRSVAMKSGGFSVDYASLQDYSPYDNDWGSYTAVRNAWHDRARESAHLNWTPEYEGYYEGHGSPIHRLAWLASYLSGRGSLMVGMLDHNFDYTDFSDSDDDSSGEAPSARRVILPLGPDRMKHIDALKRLSTWLIVVKTIVVHSDIRTASATGLFGLLGDARVQIVDISEEATVNQYYKLAEACERESKASSAFSQDFSRAFIRSVESELKEVLLRRFRDEQLAAVMRPAIMFRLCTLMCNCRGSAYGG